MSKVEIEFVLDEKGVRKLLKSDDMLKICMRYATKMQQAAGPGYKAEERSRYPERVGAAVYPATAEANIDNLENNTLEKVRRAV